MNDISQDLPGSPPDKEDPRPARGPLADQKKNALLRYMAVLFCVAFLLVLLSYLIQMRDSRQTISQLNQSNASALQNAGKLQGENQQLTEQNQSLNQQLGELQASLDEANGRLSEAEKDLEADTQELAGAQAQTKQVTDAYELLLQAKRAYDGGDLDTCRKDLAELSSRQDRLSAAGAELYARLQKAVSGAASGS